jgi:conjugative transfer pilus assembly protein TraH
MSKELGEVSDWAQGRQKCGAEGKREEINKRKDEKPEFKDILGDEFNVAWKAIQKNGFLSKDPQLAEFFMTLSGTIVSRRKKGRIEAMVLPSKSGDPNLIMGIIKGLIPVEIYKCDDRAENKCLFLAFKRSLLQRKKLSMEKFIAFF